MDIKKEVLSGHGQGVIKGVFYRPRGKEQSRGLVGGFGKKARRSSRDPDAGQLRVSSISSDQLIGSKRKHLTSYLIFDNINA